MTTHDYLLRLYEGASCSLAPSIRLRRDLSAAFIDRFHELAQLDEPWQLTDASDDTIAYNNGRYHIIFIWLNDLELTLVDGWLAVHEPTKDYTQTTWVELADPASLDRLYAWFRAAINRCEHLMAS